MHSKLGSSLPTLAGHINRRGGRSPEHGPGKAAGLKAHAARSWTQSWAWRTQATVAFQEYRHTNICASASPLARGVFQGMHTQ